MISESFIRSYGKATALALLTALLATLSFLAVLFLVSFEDVPGTAVGEIAWAYFMAMGAIGGATQLPNVAERLPGHRRWDRPHYMDGQRRRASDEQEYGD